MKPEKTMTEGIDRRSFMRHTGRWIAGGTLCAAVPALLTGCESMGDMAAIGAKIAAGTGMIEQSHADSITRSAQAVAKTFADITPEQEYYIGRTIAAVILSRYAPISNRGAFDYLNTLGQSLALASDRPETYGGYHFLILDSDEINALSAPGGLIFITRGLMQCCRHETALASVLAHEIAHVQHQHGLQAIEKSRITTAITTIGVEGAKTLGGQELASLTSVFEGAVQDITRTLIDNGYSRSFEYQADQTAVTILHRIGYDPNGLIEMLGVMNQRLQPGRADFAKTHPAPTDRIRRVETHISPLRSVTPNPARQRRFLRAMRLV